MNPVIVDVREAGEYRAEHIAGSIHVPLSEFGLKAPALLAALADRDVTLMCLGGKRAGLALQEARGFGTSARLAVYEGGLTAWKLAGKPTVASAKVPLPIMRQVQIVAGLMILTSVALATQIAPAWIGLAAFVGLGLTFAGLTGFCGMAELLSKMPWNR